MKKNYCRFARNIFVHTAAILLLAFPLSLTSYSKGDNSDTAKEKSSLQSLKRIKCASPKKAIIIDGLDKEWKTNRTSVINEKTSVGFYKDDNSLYVHLLTSDPEFSMQIMSFGLTFWFNPEKSRNNIGVQFPVVQLMPPPPREGRKPPSGIELERILKKRLKTIVLEFPEQKKMKKMSITDANKLGIDATIGIDSNKGSICYELKYPLRSSRADTMGIDLNKKKYMDVYIETPGIDPSKLRKKYKKPREFSDNGKPRSASDKGMRPPREIRPMKSSKRPRPPRPPKSSKKPPMSGISHGIRVIF